MHRRTSGVQRLACELCACRPSKPPIFLPRPQPVPFGDRLAPSQFMRTPCSLEGAWLGVWGPGGLSWARRT